MRGRQKRHPEKGSKRHPEKASRKGTQKRHPACRPDHPHPTLSRVAGEEMPAWNYYRPARGARPSATGGTCRARNRRSTTPQPGHARHEPRRPAHLPRL